MRLMETPQGTVPMPDIVELLNPVELLMFYGMMERAATGLGEVARIKEWPGSLWMPMARELSGLAIHSYHMLGKYLSAQHDDADWLYGTPAKCEWEEDESGESD